jgi:hypothetical protein
MGVGAVERLRAASSMGLVDENGSSVDLALQPGLTDAEIAAVRGQYPVPLPAELERLMSFTRGAGGLLELDLTGRLHSIEISELLPAGHPVAADGYGNFWLLDLTPDSTEVAPVFFACHDAPVLLYQAPDLATFVDEALKMLEPPHRSLVHDVHEDRLYDVWGSRPGAVPRPVAAESPDLALREFAESLDADWTLVDLRQRQVGMGIAWGCHGPGTRLARHGWERIFANAPDPRGRRSWRRLGRRTRT